MVRGVSVHCAGCQSVCDFTEVSCWLHTFCTQPWQTAAMSTSCPPAIVWGSWRAPLAGAVAGGGIAGTLFLWPSLELELLARLAAWLASLFGGGSLTRADQGWLFFSGELPVVVTVACSGADFCVLVAVLLGWQLARSVRTSALAALLGLLLSLPLSIAVNALRIALLAQAHRWLIHQLPHAYGPGAHLFLGVLIFLPALIGLNLLLESHACRRLLAASGPRS